MEDNEIIRHGVDITETLTQEEQTDLAVRLQTAALRLYELRLKNGTLSDTGLSTLQRLLLQNGWSLDPKQVPKGLKDKMTSTVDPKEFDEDDGVVGNIGAA